MPGFSNHVDGFSLRLILVLRYRYPAVENVAGFPHSTISQPLPALTPVQQVQYTVNFTVFLV